MTQEDKKLLLQELCARLPHKVKVYVGDDLAMTLRQIDYKCFCESWENEDFKSHSRWKLSYLRPMSSMTEEERKIYAKLLFTDLGGVYEDYYKALDYLNAHHFDYRGLIERGLAIEVTEENNPYEN